MLENWIVVPTRLPLVLRRCHTCGSGRARASGKFRVNANHKLLDVWLLVLCAECGETAKLTVMERTTVRSIRPELLDRLHANDLGLVAELLQDPVVQNRNRVASTGRTPGGWTSAARIARSPTSLMSRCASPRGFPCGRPA